MERWSQNVDIECSKCSKTISVNEDFYEIAGDLRLNFVKIGVLCPSENACPHCGNRMILDSTFWQREYPHLLTNGKNGFRSFTLGLRDQSEGCSAKKLIGLFETVKHPHEDDEIHLDFVNAIELTNLLYREIRNEALLSIKNLMEEKFATYENMPNNTDKEKFLRDSYETDSIEGIIPKLKIFADGIQIKAPLMADGSEFI
ncbi:hypothetical protein [Fibrobacter sp. UBA3718]|uniref:hypothetical protein n=1 Tax=Fibrobacter sp. UBA3718 TaxID=1946531 RepID=UPI0025B95C92|nr:hypothetical protein [Fibrobacter sp. UBA3718]